MLDSMTNINASIVLKELNDYIEDLPHYSPDEVAEALDMAIKALEQEPCEKDWRFYYDHGYAQARRDLSCEDAVSRQAVDTLVDELARAISDERCYMSRGRSTEIIMQDILDLPPVTPQPKIGRWIFDEILDKHYYCSECKSMGVDYWDFCPDCGAKMQEVKE